MSLKDDDRMLLVKMQMEKSRSDMHTAEVLVGENMYAVAAGRLYYAVFHAVCALLIHDNIRIKSHKGAYTIVLSELCQYRQAASNVWKMVQGFGEYA